MATATQTVTRARTRPNPRRRSIVAWISFFRKCWGRGTSEKQFQSQAFQTACHHPLGEPDIYRAWATFASSMPFIPPGHLRYLQVLLEMSLLTENAILSTIVCRLGGILTRYGANTSTDGPNPDASALNKLAGLTLRRIALTSGKSRAPPVSRSIRLFQLIGSFTGGAEARGEPLVGQLLVLGNAIGKYLVAHVNDLSKSGILAAAKGEPPNVLKKMFSKSVPRFIQVLALSGSGYKDPLILLQQQSKLQEDISETGQDDAVDLVDSVSFQQNVTDLPVLLNRASLVVFLSSLLTGRPKADDGNLRTFLDARYHDDYPSLVTDTIVASFHALAAAIERSDNPEVMSVHSSFIANKLPSLLEDYSHLLFGEKTMNNLIVEALKQVDEYYKDTPILQPRADSCPKQRFLLSTALAGLIQESQIAGLLGYQPTQGLPSVGRYQKDELVRQCQSDSKRIEQLVAEMAKMEGNTGPIAKAFLELIYTLSASRDTMTLKLICNAFLKRPHTLNYMLLFMEPRILVLPLCNLLDNWLTEDSSGEQHPVYDEFGTILLFLLVCQHRFDLPVSVFARDNQDSFVLNFLRRGFVPRQVKDLDESEQQHLNGWIKGLFESHAISDETMSNCSPKDFYSLVSTLVDQSLTACQAGVLGLKTVEEGFAFLYEPWLLPSFVPVLSWFSSRLWGLQNDAPQLDHIMRILTLLVKPPSLAQEAGQIHALLISTVALPLTRALQHVQNTYKRRQDVTSLLNTASKHARTNVTNAVPPNTLEKWMTGTGGGLQKTLSNVFEELMKLNQANKEKWQKPSYDYRCIYRTTTMLGAQNALDILLQQAWKHMGNARQQDHALDMLTAIIAATNTDPPDGRITVREALQAAVAESHVLARENHTRAQFLVRLGRRVEMHCAKPLDQGPIITALDAAAAADVVPQADLDAAAVAAVVAEVSQSVAGAGAIEPDVMVGIEQAVGAVDAAGMNQNASNSMMNMPEMGADFGLDDFMQDLDMLGGQSVDDIFASL